MIGWQRHPAHGSRFTHSFYPERTSRGLHGKIGAEAEVVVGTDAYEGMCGGSGIGL